MFVEQVEDVDAFDAAAHFDTHKDVLNRASNRPRTATLRGQVCSGVSKKTVDEVRAKCAALLLLPPKASASRGARSTKSAMHRKFLIVPHAHTLLLQFIVDRAVSVTLLLQIPRADGQDEAAARAAGCGRGIAAAAQPDGALQFNISTHISACSRVAGQRQEKESGMCWQGQRQQAVQVEARTQKINGSFAADCTLLYRSE